MVWNRKERRRLGQETVSILEAGGYEGPAGWVDIQRFVDGAPEALVSYPGEDSPPSFERRSVETRLSIHNMDSLVASKMLVDMGLHTAVLNFASAKNPGGGFLSGARAQEETLAMSSALFASINGHAMYEFHRARRDALYTSWALYSKGVPVFRDVEGKLLSASFDVDMITCAAPNAGAIDASRADEISAAMQDRIYRVLAIAAHHGVRGLVLGAWGCGAFHNDGDMVAAQFAEALEGPFAGIFDEVVFAVLDWSEERRYIGPFQRAFGFPVQ